MTSRLYSYRVTKEHLIKGKREGDQQIVQLPCNQGAPNQGEREGDQQIVQLPRNQGAPNQGEREGETADCTVTA